MVAPRLSAVAVHSLLHDGPVAVVGHDEAVQVEVEPILHRRAVDLGDEPARRRQCRAIKADPMSWSSSGVRRERALRPPHTWMPSAPLSLHSCPVGAADAGMHHVDIAAAPRRSGLSNGDAIAWSIREFDGSQPLPLMPLILHIIDLQIMPIGAPPGDLVQVVKVFLIVARITTNVAPPWQRTGRVHLVGSKPSISASIANFPTVSMTTSSPMSQGLLLPN